MILPKEALLTANNDSEISIFPGLHDLLLRKLREQEAIRLKELLSSHPSYKALAARQPGNRYWTLLCQSYLCHTPIARLLELSIQKGLIPAPASGPSKSIT